MHTAFIGEYLSFTRLLIWKIQVFQISETWAFKKNQLLGPRGDKLINSWGSYNYCKDSLCFGWVKESTLWGRAPCFWRFLLNPMKMSKGANAHSKSNKESLFIDQGTCILYFFLTSMYLFTKKQYIYVSSNAKNVHFCLILRFKL